VGDGTRSLFSWDWSSRGLETYCREKSVQIVGDTLIEAVKVTTFVLGEVAISGKGLKKAQR
jgi:hypothetical protein